MVRMLKIEEPSFTGLMNTVQMIEALNWYHQNKENRDAQSYIQEYIKKNKLIGKVNTNKSYLTLAWLCQLKMNGNDIGHGNDYIDREIVGVLQEEIIEKVDIIPTITIQDRIREKASECIGEIEGQLDDLIASGFKANTSPYAVMHTLDIKGIHANRVINFFKVKRQEYNEVLTTDDKSLKEGYSNFNKTELKKLIAFCDSVIIDGMKVTEAATKSRKPRKRKVKSSAELIAKLKFCSEFAELNLKSVDPKQIVGAMQLWVYNTKKRKLGSYFAEDAGGFSIKGSSLLNFSETKSIQKKLRKPAITTQEVLTAGKITLKKLLDNINAVEAGLSGRINEDVIILKVIK